MAPFPPPPGHSPGPGAQGRGRAQAATGPVAQWVLRPLTCEGHAQVRVAHFHALGLQAGCVHLQALLLRVQLLPLHCHLAGVQVVHDLLRHQGLLNCKNSPTGNHIGRGPRAGSRWAVCRPILQLRVLLRTNDRGTGEALPRKRVLYVSRRTSIGKACPPRADRPAEARPRHSRVTAFPATVRPGCLLRALRFGPSSQKVEGPSRWVSKNCNELCPQVRLQKHLNTQTSQTARGAAQDVGRSTRLSRPPSCKPRQGDHPRQRGCYLWGPRPPPRRAPPLS